MIVLGTNILVAALWSRNGASNRLLTMAIAGQVEVAISVALALEYEDVLTRDTMRDASWASTTEVGIVLDALLASATLVMPIRTRLRPTLRDADDEMVLECAVQSGADTIVTMNQRDFLLARSIYRIAIESPGQCLNRLKGQ